MNASLRRFEVERVGTSHEADVSMGVSIRIKLQSRRALMIGSGQKYQRKWLFAVNEKMSNCNYR
jgi:hypothetical protein